MDADGTKTNLDCDLNVPTMPCNTRYDGSIGDIESYLEKERPINWTDELSKLQVMTAAGKSGSQLKKDNWPVKFRLINPSTVLPRQVRDLLWQEFYTLVLQALLFMTTHTFCGVRKDIYVLMKILKYVTGSSVKSYECKYAVHEVFKNKEPNSDKLGDALNEVMQFQTIRGQFESVHDDLKNYGVTKVVIGDNALDFVGKNYYKKNGFAIFA